MKLSPFLLALLAVFGVKVKAEDSPHTKEPLTEIKKAVDDNKAMIVDVREKSEWDEGHLKGAAFVPLSTLKGDQKAPGFLPKDRPLYLHCVRGVRSVMAAEILKKQGYDARALKEGFEELSKTFEPAK